MITGIVNGIDFLPAILDTKSELEISLNISKY